MRRHPLGYLMWVFAAVLFLDGVFNAVVFLLGRGMLDRYAFVYALILAALAELLPRSRREW